MMQKLIIGFALASCLLAPAAAQRYPSKPVKVVVPLAPGGATDIQARIFSQKLSERLGQPFLVDNRPGAGGTISYAFVARSPADGYTLLAVASDFTMTPWMYSNLSYDPVKDFAPVSRPAESPFLLVVHPSTGVNSVKELIDLARAKPGVLNFASGGQGSSLHVALELFKFLAAVNIVHVPYKGGGPALAETVAGHVDGTFSNIVTSVPQVRAGKLRALASTGPARASILPDLPTMVEAGVPGYVTTGWHGWLAPGATPEAIVHLVSSELAKVVELPEVAKQIIAEGGRPLGGTPEDFRQYLGQDLARWSTVIRKANIRVE